jgi:hypothetical protein
MLPMSSGTTRATGPARGAGVGPGLRPGRACRRGRVRAGGRRCRRRQRAERAGEARAMLGKKGVPSLFKFGFKVVPREEAAARASARLAVQRECALCGVVGCSSSGWRRCNSKANPKQIRTTNPKKKPAAAFCRLNQNSNLSNQTPSTVHGMYLSNSAQSGARRDLAQGCGLHSRAW